MKKIFFLLLIAFATKTIGQNSNYLISMNGIGALKIGMSQADIERLLNQKFTLRNARYTAVSHNDSATATYKNSSVQLFFQRQYTSENNYYMYLIGMKTNSLLCKTEAGIRTGSAKLEIIAAYEANNIRMGPECEDEACTKMSKTKYRMNVKNEDGKRAIIFYLSDKKVVAIEVATVFSDEE